MPHHKDEKSMSEAPSDEIFTVNMPVKQIAVEGFLTETIELGLRNIVFQVCQCLANIMLWRTGYRKDQAKPTFRLGL